MFNEQLLKLSKVQQLSKYYLMQKCVSEQQVFSEVLDALYRVKNIQGKVYLIGNGGSAGIASHFSIDILNVLKIPSFTFYDSSQLTCLANDYGYEKIFSTPLSIALKEGDLLIAISSSGNSSNILEGVKTAKSLGTKIITFSGFSEENPLKKLGDINFWANSKEYGIVETIHFFWLHTIIDSWLKYVSKCEELVSTGQG